MPLFDSKEWTKKVFYYCWKKLENKMQILEKQEQNGTMDIDITKIE